MSNATNLSPAHDVDIVMSDAMDAEEISEQELFEAAAKSRSAVRPPNYQTVALPQVAFPLPSSYHRMAEDPPDLDAALEADIFDMYAAREAKREDKREKLRVSCLNWYSKHREEHNANGRAVYARKKRKSEELAEALANASSPQEREMVVRQIEEQKSKRARTQKETRQRRKAKDEAEAVAELEAAVAAVILLLLHYRQPQQ